MCKGIWTEEECRLKFFYHTLNYLALELYSDMIEQNLKTYDEILKVMNHKLSSTVESETTAWKLENFHISP